LKLNKEIMKVRWYAGCFLAILVVWILPAYATAAETGKGVEKFINHSFCQKDSLVDKCDDVDSKNLPVYYVSKSAKELVIDANWNKPEWEAVKAIEIANYMGEIPLFLPRTEVKMMYTDESLLIIFRVHDRYVRSRIRKFNGPVYEDSCVEFFFSPDATRPEEYFDLEMNCGGTPLICYVPNKKEFTTEDIEKISIAHSMPAVVDPEIKEPVTWTIECKIPFKVLEKFSNLVRPSAGACWRGNFFKTASKTSNPHYVTWAIVKSSKPNFHLPQFFGKLKFI
jgi:Domain of unknown function (DUF1083).